MKTRAYLVLSAGIFAAVASAHLVRLAMGWSLCVGPFRIPLFLSVFGVLGPGLLSAWGFAQARKT